MTSTKIVRHLVLTVATGFVVMSAFGQKGPGGVSVETADTQTGPECSDIESTCGLWLDASTITALTDGANLMTWEDVSLSSDCDDAIANNASTPPIYRNDPAFTINGFPTVTFEEGRFLRIASSEDLNTEQISFTRTILFAFRTSEDVTTKQILYEEGGTVRGFNVSIHNGRIIIGSYDWAGNDNDGPGGQDTPPWGYTYTMEEVDPSTTYILTAKMYAAEPVVVEANNNYYVKGWLNGVAFSNPDFPLPLTNDPKFENDLNYIMYQGKGDPDNNNNPTSWGPNNGIGTLARHPNPCGLGAINSDMVDKDGVRSNDTGENSFSGLLAEMIVYRGELATDEITDVKRIIVENYLGAKYLADLQSGDKYPYEFLYGRDLIGLGRNTASGPVHGLSQGRNPFAISANPISNDADAYFFTGHNGQPINWTDQGVPNNSSNIERLQRIWRVARTSGFSGNVTLHIDLNDTEAPNISPPTGYDGAILVLLADETSANIPNFSLPSTKVLELAESPTTPGLYQLPTYAFENGTFFTLGWLKPEVSFASLESFSVENDPSPVFEPVTIEVRLNYQPFPSSPPHFVDYTLNPGTAQIAANWPPIIPGDDFYYNSDANGLTGQTLEIPSGNQSANITLRIINDAEEETPLTEDFTIELISALNGLLLGPDYLHVHTIYDNDPPPEIFFPTGQTAPVWQEDVGTGVMTVAISDEVNTDFRIYIDDNSGVILSPNARPSALGLDPADYDFTEGQLYSITSGTTIDIPITILEDFVDEGTEIVKARIFPVSGAAAPDDPSGLTFEFNIIDNDVPTPTFTAATQAGFESNGSPSLLVTLGDQSDPTRVISARDVIVDYDMQNGAINPASYNNDYSGSQNGQILFQPFADDAFIGPFNVVNDGLEESPENIDFTLTGGSTDGEPIVLGAIPSMTYTIYDYTAFEFQGVAGIGRARDNVIWIDASQEPLNTNIAELDNKAPNFPNPNQPIRIRRDGSSSGATNLANGIGSKNALDFNGLPNPAGAGGTGSATTYQIDNNSRINTAGTVDKLSYFFVVRPETIPSSSTTPSSPDNRHGRLIYEQGAGARGISIYLYNRRFYFHAWNNANDDGSTNDASPDNQAPWGHNGNPSNSVYAQSHQISTSPQDYVISCHYDNNNVADPLRIYVNGRKGTFSEPNPVASTVGRLWGHAGAVGLGGVVGGTRFHFANNSPSDKKCAFDGKIAEYISFFEPEMNEARRIIIENSLAAKYGITLDDNNSGITTPQVFDVSGPNALDFNYQVAGIGQSALGVGHNTAQGPNANLRVRNASFSSETTPSYIIWGHNNETLTNTWPFSSPENDLPAGINERSGQVWKVFNTGASASAEFIINFSSSDNAFELLSTNSLRLLVHSNDADPNDFGSAIAYSGTMQSGYEALFDNISITNGMYIALGNTSDYFNTPLPIELLSFNAQLKGSYVDLRWETATEINNDYFVVERASENLDWKPILTVTGAGNSNSLISYSDKDRDPLKGLSYYRLKQVDFDGGFSYSDPVSVFNQTIDDSEDVFMYPNPSTAGSVFLKVPFVTSVFDTEVRLFDIKGQLLVSRRFNANSDLFEFKFGDVAPGVYLVNISSAALNETKKLIIE